MQYPDMMVDLETTGISPDHSAIIQIAAVRFNFETGEIDPNIFDQCLLIPNNRYFDESTRKWWAKQGDILTNVIMPRMRDPRTVVHEFYKWCMKDGEQPKLWAKPSHFEFPLMQSYFKEYGPSVPFHYRYVEDMNSWIRGAYYPETPPDIYKEMQEKLGTRSHVAIDDVFLQLAILFEAREAKK